MRPIYASETDTLVLGFQGEDQRLEIWFPLVDEKTGRNLTEEFPGGSFSISIMLPGDPEEHIVGSEDFRIDGNWLIWTVKEAYTTGFGEGKLQLNYAFGGMAKSRIWKTSVRKSIGTGAGTVPDWSDWKTELLNAANQVQQAVDSYDEMTAEAEDGDTTEAEIDRTGDHPVLRMKLRRGEDGQDAPQIDDTQASPENPWSGQKTKQEIDTVYSAFRSSITKILDVTLDEEAALTVTEIDGEQLSAEELHMVVKCPTGIEISAGSAYVYNGSTSLGEAYHVARNASDTGIYWFASFKKDGGVWASKMSRTISSGSLVQVWEYFVSDLINERYARSCITYPKITQLKLPAFPAGTRIVLYAR